MPNLLELNWGSFPRGEDSEGYSIDPLSIVNGYASIMENIEPSAGRLRPRYGSLLKLENNTNITWMGEFQKEGSGYVIWLDDHTLYGMNIYSGNAFVIREGWNLDDAIISTTRVGIYLIVAVDSSDQSMVIYEDVESLKLKWFSCIITNTGNPFSSLDGTLCDANGNEISDPSSYNGDTSGGFNVTVPRNLTVTFVKLPDSYAGNQYDLSTGQPGTLLESSEDISARLKCSFIKWGKGKYNSIISSSSIKVGNEQIANDAFNIGANWTGTFASGFVCAASSSSPGNIYGTSEFTVNKRYRLSITVSSYTKGYVKLTAGGISVTASSAGTFTNEGIATEVTKATITPSSTFIGTITVSVKSEYTEYTCVLTTQSTSISNGSCNGFKTEFIVDGSSKTVYVESSEYKSSTNTTQTWVFVFDKEYSSVFADSTSFILNEITDTAYHIDGMGNLYLTVANTFTVPNNATHVRVYITLPATVTNYDFDTAQVTADGLYLRWLIDIPVYKITSGNVIKIPTSDGYLKGSENLCWSTGRDEFPGGVKAIFANGRMWLGPRSNANNVGRWYASSKISGATLQLSKALSFSMSNDYINTSTDEAEASVGAGISQGHLIIFNKQSVYCLKNCDIDSEPVCISKALGAIGGITEINQQIYYLSNRGPAVVSGTVVDRFSAMKSAATSANLYGKSKFFNKGRKINGFFHNDSWILSDGEKNAAFLMRGDRRGSWSLTSQANMKMLCSCHPTKDTCWVGGGSSDIYSIMEKGVAKDGAFAFKARLYSNATSIPQNKDCGEAYDVRVDLNWSDSGSVGVALYGDFTRIENIYSFSLSQDTGMANEVPKKQYGPFLQGIRAGAISHWFIVGIEKWVYSNDILFGGFKLRVVPRKYHPEQISVSFESDDSVVTDDGFFGFDQDFTAISENVAQIGDDGVDQVGDDGTSKTGKE